jgi:hypothetical protein
VDSNSRFGQNSSSKLLRGIFVALLPFAVALMRSTTVLSRSLFSGGSWAMRDRKALMRDLEGGGTWLKEGMARVEREGGL